MRVRLNNQKNPSPMVKKEKQKKGKDWLEEFQTMVNVQTKN